ncbi:MAG: restriction endonuclease subunit S [Bacteroidales bacterium]|jgi:type I restriction enzyme S subunit|nr:restriction endonuclease subunit S [Bacteroidales bacterium]MBP7873764.1 restriction endonuclease subunit S [Bacteroidales bacterium]MCZ2283014.1 restriction endonuclease subunit S [Bacteroidales bacterium]
MAELTKYETYKPSGINWIGEVPIDWKTLRIKNVASIVNGSTPSSSVEEYWDGDIIWATPGDFNKFDKIIDDSESKITEAGYKSCGTSMVPVGSVVITTRAPIGNVLIAGKELCTNQGCKSLVPNRIESRFLYYIISISSIELNILGQGTTFLELSKESLGTFKLPLPKYDEQLAIANYLDNQTQKIDRLIANKKAQAEKLKELRQIEINNAVTKGLKPNAEMPASSKVEMKDSGIEWLGKIPKHWEVKRLKNTTFINQSVISEKTAPDYLIKYIDISNVNSMGEFIELQEMEFSEAPSRARRIPKHNSILLSTVRTYLRAIALVQNPDKNLIASTGFAVIDANQNLFNASYLYFQMISHFLVESVIANSEGVSYPAISSTKLGDIKIVIPPINEQSEIANFLQQRTTAIDQLIKNIEAQIEKLQELRKIRIYEAVTGKIKVNAYAEKTA